MERTESLLVKLDWGNNADPIEIANITTSSGQLIIEFTSEYVQSGFDLAPLMMPAQYGTVTHSLGHSFGPLPGLFDDAMPDDWGRRVMDVSFAQIGFTSPTVLDRLAWLGSSTMGALTFHPSNRSETESVPFDLGAAYRESQEVITGSAEEVLSVLARAGGSPGGARPKLLAGINTSGQLVSGEAHLPPGFEPWLIKFRAPVDSEHAGAVEFAYLKMAADAGIEVCDSQLLTDDIGMAHIALKRFDREPNTATIRKLHMSTVSGLIHADHRFASIDCETLLRLVRRMTGDRRAVCEMFRRCVFNVLAHNRDEHTKNTSLLMSAEQRWVLSPAYDLTFAYGPGGQHTMSINGKGKDIERSDVFKLGEGAGIDAQECQQVIAQVEEAVSNWQDHAQNCGVPKEEAVKIQQYHGWAK